MRTGGSGGTKVRLHDVEGDAPAAPLEQLLTFRLGGERYGVPIGAIVEILKYRRATPVPRAHPVIHGIVSLRGRIITVIDGRVRLDLPATPPQPASRIIVVRDGSEPVGILVDEVMEVIRLPADAVKPPPPTVGEAASRGISGVCDTRQGSILVLLDPHRYLRFEEDS